jgi:hypothetical protein
LKDMKKWYAFSAVPPAYLKRIDFGTLKGKSDISPQWRIKAMTEVFGMCGEGWYHDLDKMWDQSGANGEHMVFCKVNVYLKLDDGSWSAPIVGIGGNTTIDKNKNGLQANDEGWKMAYTDALGTAMKSIGVASEVYEGNWDGSKYSSPKNATNEPEQLPEMHDCTKLIETALANKWDLHTAIEMAEKKYTVSDVMKRQIADRLIGATE